MARTRSEKKKWIDKSESVTKKQTCTVIRTYSYYYISKLEVYGLKNAEVTNTALPGGRTTLLPSGYIPPNVTAQTMSPHLQEPVIKPITLPSASINGGKGGKPTIPSENFTAAASAAVDPIKVRNDKLIFNGTVLMDSGWHENSTPSPKMIPLSPRTGRDVFYKNNLTINPTLANGIYNSSGKINYYAIAQINSTHGSSLDIPVTGINDVEVHTPSVNYSTAEDVLSYNQVVDLDNSVPNLVIDRTFTFNYPNSGQHRNILGYGLNNYLKYFKNKQIKADFDMYLGNDRTGTFIEKNTWHSLALSDENYTFFIPHWVEENDYTILTRTVPINAPADLTGVSEYFANLTLTNYSAVKAVPVKLVGQLYDFKIISTNDGYWDDFFFDTNGNYTGKQLYVGEKDKLGVLDSSHVYTMPMDQNKSDVVGQDNYVVKKGSSVYFSVKTNGNMKDQNDFLLVTPTFYYVDSSYGGRQEVDIWYLNNNKYVKLANNLIDIKASLNNAHMAISDTEIGNTAYANYHAFGGGAYSTLSDYTKYYQYQDTRTSKKIGTSSMLALDHEQKTFVGDTSGLPASVNALDALMGVQQFYGAYYLPPTSIFVPKGTAAVDVSSSSLKNGYVVMNVAISTVDNFTGAIDTHLSYDDASCNMFDVEGFKTNQNGRVFEYGDMILFYTDKSSSGDYSQGGTH